MKNKSKELQVAIRAALEAGKVLEKHFETDILKEFKEDKSIVTLADRESEEVIKKNIFADFPNHSLHGEETGITNNQSDYFWYVDPIDGTKNFANGIPIFAVSVALVYKGETIVGVVYNPASRSLFYAEKGEGAYLNDKRIFVSKDNWEDAIVTTCANREVKDKELARNLQYSLPKKIKSVRNLGSCALELAMVARGGVEGNFQIGLSPYDFAAGALLVKEAGGKLTKFDGNDWKFPENYFIASNGTFHDLLVKEVQEQKAKLQIKD